MLKAQESIRRFLDSVDPDSIFKTVVSSQKVQQLIIDTIQQDQLFQGIDGTGRELTDIGGFYSRSYAEFKSNIGLPSGRVTLFLTGDFYRTFKINTGKGYFEVEADTIKDGVDLQIRWGDDLLKLTDESHNKIAELIFKETLRILRATFQQSIR